jgi:hypothetical protein
LENPADSIRWGFRGGAGGGMKPSILSSRLNRSERGKRQRVEAWIQWRAAVVLSTRRHREQIAGERAVRRPLRCRTKAGQTLVKLVEQTLHNGLYPYWSESALVEQQPATA